MGTRFVMGFLRLVFAASLVVVIFVSLVCFAEAVCLGPFTHFFASLYHSIYALSNKLYRQIYKATSS